MTLARKITKGLTQIEMRLQKIFLVKWRIWWNRQKPDQRGANGRCTQKLPNGGNGIECPRDVPGKMTANDNLDETAKT